MKPSFCLKRNLIRTIPLSFIIALNAIICVAQESIQTDSLPAQTVDQQMLKTMVNEIYEQKINVHSFLLFKNNELVAEEYFNSYDRNTPHKLYSVTKTVTSLLIGIAIDKGYIKSVDENLIDLIPEWFPANPDPNLLKIKLKHLLTMSTGHTTDVEDDAIEINPDGNWYKTMLEFPVHGEPGEKFYYNTGASCILTIILHEKCGMSVSDFASEYLFKPLGINSFDWEEGPDGIVVGGWGLYLKPVDMVKIGQLILEKGKFSGNRIVPESWIEEMSAEHISTGIPGNGYGYQVWLNDFGGIRADGYLGQRIYILPEYDAVVVFTAELKDSQVLYKFVKQYVLPSMM